MDISNIDQVEKATAVGQQDIARLGAALLFLLIVFLYATSHLGSLQGGGMLVAAAVIGGYMALNIGANDVANNVGPIVGARAVTLLGALMIAAIFEASGALIAGGNVVSTIKKGIIDPQLVADTSTFVWLMMAALLAGGIWLNLATAVGAPVSTTHSIVGGVLGAGIAAGGMEVAHWGTMGKIAASWVISPALGGALAATFLFAIKKTVLFQPDRIHAARRWVPLWIGLMIWAFSTYLIIKGLKHLYKVPFGQAAIIGFGVAVVAWLFVKARVARQSRDMDNNRESVSDLFTWPLILAAAFLSFAHGANDVANAVGPLAAITDALEHGVIHTKAAIPTWVMMVGAVGISIGLLLYGPRVIRTVGSEITELDKTRAFCISLAAAMTVILASQLGLPVSTTHIAVGAVFGVGFLREILKTSYASELHKIAEQHDEAERERIEKFLKEFRGASVDEMKQMLDWAKKHKKEMPLTKPERKRLKKVYKEKLVTRSHLWKIAAAWVITVPATAVIAAIAFYAIRGFMLP
ncbi:inorganic phosphate transporter [Hahella sp. SMD15-11]|uniref:Phosphate transporter n=1 Tax=Thermohahella caldifontis TaxID=3142973 RepID=A0AB39URE8_9GAMM